MSHSFGLPAFLLKHLHFSWSTILCLPACCGACSREVAAEGACPVSLLSAEVLPSCQRQNVTLFSSSCGCEKCKSQDFASAPGAAFRTGVNFGRFKIRLKKSLCLTARTCLGICFELWWTFKENDWTWQELPLLNGLSMIFSISKLFLSLRKNPGQLWPTYPWSWDENNPDPRNSLSCCLCKFWPHHVVLGGG